MIADHIVKSYDQEITLPDAQDPRDGRPGRAPGRRAIEALVTRNVELADQVVEHDDRIDTLEEEIDQLAIRMLATRQPMAVDLRLIAMAMKISNDLERIGDYAAKGIAKRCHRLAKEPARVRPLYAIPRMGELAQAMVKDVLDAYVERDADKAVAVWHRDDEVDVMYDGLVFRELLDLHDGGPAQHLGLHRSHVHRQEPRADGRPHHQHLPRRSTTSSTASASTACRCTVRPS